MVKIAQIGCGYWGKNLTRNFAEIGVLGGVVDGNPDTAKFFAQTFNVPELTFESALADPDIDGIALSTPATTHARLSSQALNAGKHVFVEKPLALDIQEAEDLVSLATKKNLKLMVGHLLQYHPTFLTLMDHVRSNRIGELQYVYSNRMSFGKFRVEENVLWSFAPHDLSMILGIIGEEPSSVEAQGASIITPGVADWCTAQLVFPSGVRGHIQTSWLHPFKEQRLVVIGSEGMIVFEDSEPVWDHKLRFYNHRVHSNGPVPNPEKADCEYLPVTKGEPLKNECQHFIDCIASGGNPRTDGLEGLSVLKVLSKVEKALEASLRRTVL